MLTNTNQDNDLRILDAAEIDDVAGGVVEGGCIEDPVGDAIRDALGM